MLKRTWKKSYHWVLCRITLLPYPSTTSTTSTTTTTTSTSATATATFIQSPQHSPQSPMILCIKAEEGNDTGRLPRSLHFLGKRTFGKKTLAKDMVLRESPNSLGGNKHVVIVMDALREFSIEPLQWALDHVIASGYVVTLLGIMPWLNLPLSCKTWLDVWTLDLQDLAALREKYEWNNDIKYQKVREIIELCHKYGVVPDMKVVHGYPSRLLVLEQTTSLHANWVIFDRHHRKHRAFYAKRIPCNIVMMNNDGEMDILKARPMIDKGDTTPGESPAILPIVPKVIISKKLMKFLKPIKEHSNEDEETENP